MSMPLGAVVTIYLVATYFVCGIPFGKIVARRNHVDISHVGSGNIGTTNVGRTVGAPAAGLTLALDAGKGLLCTALARPVLATLCLGGDASALANGAELGWVVALVYLGCIVGHVFSPYLRGHGGKGISVGFGGALGFGWEVALGLLVVWVVAVAPTRIVSAGSCAAAVSLPIWSFVFYRPSWAYLAIMCAISAIVLWAHRSNLRKLFRGEEKRFSFHHDGEPPAASGRDGR